MYGNDTPLREIRFPFTENKMMLALSANEPDVLVACTPDPSQVEPEFRAVSILSDLYDREIISTIGWAKQVPGKPIFYDYNMFCACQ
jgi:hypothetical protein